MLCALTEASWESSRLLVCVEWEVLDHVASAGQLFYKYGAVGCAVASQAVLDSLKSPQIRVTSDQA